MKSSWKCLVTEQNPLKRGFRQIPPAGIFADEEIFIFFSCL